MSLDAYDVIRELGRGGMAVVHLARQRELGRLVALKELGGFNVSDPAAAERFLRESQLAGSLNHPSIVTVYEYFEQDGTPFIAMELMEGGSLRPLIGELSLPKVAGVLENLLAAMGHAGLAGIVHRDLKPENALVTREGRVKVADFGIAKAAQSGQENLTSQGMTVGTPEYMSPEQAMAGDVGPASDLYAVGCITYEMLTGRLPFRESTQMALLMKHVNEPVPDVREVDPLIPESVALWVTRMTAKDPDERPDSAAAAWDAFEEAVLEHVGPLWRRDAQLEPGSTIDVDDLPPQTATPLRPTPGPSAAPLGGTGFQTYHAPAALHEQLAAEGGDGAAVATPPPAPAAPAPRPRPVTPPPARAAPVPAAVVTPPPAQAARSPAAREEEHGLPVVPVALGAVAAGVVAFVIGMSGGGSSATASAGGDGFVLKAPSGWAKADAGAVPGLGSDAVALSPPGAARGEAIVAGRADRVGAGLLPAPLAPGGAAPELVQLGAGQAAHHGGVRGGAAQLEAYALPTDAGTVVVACTAAAAVRESCAAAAGSLEITRGKAVAAGPTDDGAQAVGGALSRLRDAAGNPVEDLARARSRSAQAVAAGDLARAYRAAAGDLADAPVGALAAGPRTELARALDRLGDAWAAYARGARSGNAAAARSAVGRARGAVRSARARLAAAGYPEGGG